MANKLFGTDGVRGIAGEYPLNIDFALNWLRFSAKKFAMPNIVLPLPATHVFPVLCFSAL